MQKIKIQKLSYFGGFQSPEVRGKKKKKVKIIRVVYVIFIV
jgi:hypothetical protein